MCYFRSVMQAGVGIIRILLSLSLLPARIFLDSTQFLIAFVNFALSAGYRTTGRPKYMLFDFHSPVKLLCNVWPYLSPTTDCLTNYSGKLDSLERNVLNYKC